MLPDPYRSTSTIPEVPKSDPDNVLYPADQTVIHCQHPEPSCPPSYIPVIRTTKERCPSKKNTQQQCRSFIQIGCLCYIICHKTYLPTILMIVFYHMHEEMYSPHFDGNRFYEFSFFQFLHVVLKFQLNGYVIK